MKSTPVTTPAPMLSPAELAALKLEITLLFAKKNLNLVAAAGLKLLAAGHSMDRLPRSPSGRTVIECIWRQPSQRKALFTAAQTGQMNFKKLPPYSNLRHQIPELAWVKSKLSDDLLFIYACATSSEIYSFSTFDFEAAANTLKIALQHQKTPETQIELALDVALERAQKLMCQPHVYSQKAGLKIMKTCARLAKKVSLSPQTIKKYVAVAASRSERVESQARRAKESAALLNCVATALTHNGLDVLKHLEVKMKELGPDYWDLSPTGSERLIDMALRMGSYDCASYLIQSGATVWEEQMLCDPSETPFSRFRAYTGTSARKTAQKNNPQFLQQEETIFHLLHQSGIDALLKTGKTKDEVDQYMEQALLKAAQSIKSKATKSSFERLILQECTRSRSAQAAKPTTKNRL